MTRRPTSWAVSCLLVALSACSAPPVSQPDPPADLPAQVALETTTESFTSRWDVAIRDGLLWLKPRDSTSWRLAPPDGLPAPPGFSILDAATWLPGFERPRRLVEVSADGENLLVIAPDRSAYYAKLSHYAKEGVFEWTNEFGLLPWDSGTVQLPEGYRAVAISHRGPDVSYYEDIDGNKHHVSVGVSTLYLLDRGGQVIHYADPWLEPDWSHIFYTPVRGRFVAVNLSASGSTMFVINRYGEMFTRLADFDTTGENPIPWWYSYERRFRDGGSIRSLPGEEWRRQPLITAPITGTITIVQTGQGNASRELRVQGLDPQAEQAGYWTKPIHSGAWTFVAVAGMTIDGKQLLNNLAVADDPPDLEGRLGPGFDRVYEGRVVSGCHGPSWRVRVEQFNPHNTPARVRIELGTEQFLALLHLRRVHPTSDGGLATDRATLEILPETQKSGHWLVRRLIQDVFSGGHLVEVEVSISPDGEELCIEGDLNAELRRLSTPGNP